jgi:hypothetical protein
MVDKIMNKLQCMTEEATAYVQQRSWRARRSKHTQDIVFLTIHHFTQLRSSDVNNMDKTGLQQYIKYKVETDIRESEHWYIVSYILHWLLDIIIDLVIDWLLNKAQTIKEA